MSQQEKNSSNLENFMKDNGGKMRHFDGKPKQNKVFEPSSNQTFQLRRTLSKRNLNEAENIDPKRYLSQSCFNLTSVGLENDKPVQLLQTARFNLDDFMNSVGVRRVPYSKFMTECSKATISKPLRMTTETTELLHSRNSEVSFVINLDEFMSSVGVRRVPYSKFMAECSKATISKPLRMTSGTTELLLRRNSDLQEFIPKMKKFLENNAINISDEKILESLCKSFDCGNKQPKNCVEEFSKMTKLSVPKVCEMMMYLDPAGSSTAVIKYIDSLSADIKKWKFYAGATHNYDERKRSHNKIHLTLLGQQLIKVDSFSIAAFAETAAICTVKNLVQKKVIAGTWNQSYGYDSPSLVNAAVNSKETIIYMIYSPRPFERPKFDQGSLKCLTRRNRVSHALDKFCR